MFVSDRVWTGMKGHGGVPHLRSHAVTSLGFSTTYVEVGSGGRDRTYDQLINSQLLYR